MPDRQIYGHPIFSQIHISNLGKSSLTKRTSRNLRRSHRLITIRLYKNDVQYVNTQGKIMYAHRHDITFRRGIAILGRPMSPLHLPPYFPSSCGGSHGNTWGYWPTEKPPHTSKVWSFARSSVSSCSNQHCLHRLPFLCPCCPQISGCLLSNLR